MEYCFLIRVYQLKGHIKTTELEGFGCCRKETKLIKFELGSITVLEKTYGAQMYQ
jgi:hypothetical protein